MPTAIPEHLGTRTRRTVAVTARTANLAVTGAGTCLGVIAVAAVAGLVGVDVVADVAAVAFMILACTGAVGWLVALMIASATPPRHVRTHDADDVGAVGGGVR